MAITVVGTSQGSATTGTQANFTRTAGAINNLLVVGVGQADESAAPTISDTQTNTWNPIIAFDDTINAGRVSSWYALAKNTSSTTITVQSNTPSTFITLTVDEFTGNLTTSPLDVSNHSVAGSAGTPISPSFSPSVDNELVWAFVTDSATVGNIDGSTATLGGNDGSGDISEFRVLVGRSGVSMTAAFTGSGNYILQAATFKPAGAGATAHLLTCTGAGA